MYQLSQIKTYLHYIPVHETETEIFVIFGLELAEYKNHFCFVSSWYNYNFTQTHSVESPTQCFSFTSEDFVMFNC